ncbi:unnamed protein product [Allacma fusca]|uniref:Uncharacterized protein n=1 Tax=Allacma fusca TaxID=39272 RepID=A0A8J2JDY0_9HEXA|nr:unnamed protein product [Allacma fusca]
MNFAHLKIRQMFPLESHGRPVECDEEIKTWLRAEVGKGRQPIRAERVGGVGTGFSKIVLPGWGSAPKSFSRATDLRLALQIFLSSRTPRL